MKDGLLVNVRYTVKPGKRNAFLEETSRQGIISESRTEPGNIKYEYYIPVESENDLFLMEMWVSSEAQAAHGKTAHYKMLQALKEEYITAITIEKYHTSAISN
nr:putative quinol monooxygenase [Acetobacterium paludosum]